MHNFNHVEYLYEMIQVKEKLSHRVASKQFLEFKEKLGLYPYNYNFDEQDIISTLQVAFEGKITHTQYGIQNKRPDLCFSKQKLVIEINKYAHVDRDPEYEKEGQKLMEDHGYTVIRTNPDAPDFSINRLINQKYIHIIKSTEESTKKSMIDDLRI